MLKKRGLVNKIQKKAFRNVKLTKKDIARNKNIGKDRYKVERVFGSIKRWFKSEFCRYIGKAKTHTQHTLEAIAYNLYRLPRLLCSI